MTVNSTSAADANFQQRRDYGVFTGERPLCSATKSSKVCWKHMSWSQVAAASRRRNTRRWSNNGGWDSTWKSGRTQVVPLRMDTISQCRDNVEEKLPSRNRYSARTLKLESTKNKHVISNIHLIVLNIWMQSGWALHPLMFIKRAAGTRSTFLSVLSQIQLLATWALVAKNISVNIYSQLRCGDAFEKVCPSWTRILIL